MYHSPPEKSTADDGVYDLISELCANTATKYCSNNKVSQKRLKSQMRSCAFEIILKKTAKDIPTNKQEPIAGLVSCYFQYRQNTRNVLEYKRATELKQAISTLRKMDFGEDKEIIYNILRFVIGLCGSFSEDVTTKLFENPFSFGMLDEMLPKPKVEVFGSPQPYTYFPPHVFDLNYSINKQGVILNSPDSQTYTEYTVESFDSLSFLPENSKSQMRAQSELKTFISPMSIASLTSTYTNPYSMCDSMFHYPRLTAPRDLQIPLSCSNEANVKVSLASTNVKEGTKEVYWPKSPKHSVDIWELATQIDKDVPENIWEIVSKLPPIHERQLVASNVREVALWRQTYDGMFYKLNVVSEKLFIRHIMYLIIGIETSSFPFNQNTNNFTMKKNLVLEGISQHHIRHYVNDLLLIGTYYRRLYKFAFNETLENHFHTNGLIYEAAREVIRKYLLEFRLTATNIYDTSKQNTTENLPTLLQILLHLEPLKQEIETIASIYMLIDADVKASIPYGAELMSYLFNEISMITHKNTILTMYNSLYSICQVYFKFIERFIFEGELDDRFNEFFIRKDNQYVNCRSKRYWDKGFHIQNVAVPEFLKTLAKYILLCGKSLRLLKLCNPSDPLVLLISSDHPSVKCCASFTDLERQQQLLDVYRTRCLFVTGELVTFDQILLKKEAERKAFTEMAHLKQAETMEKIVAERKRLAQLIIAEKQHSLRVLEAAMAEAKAAKTKAKHREKIRHVLEQAVEQATEEVDSRLRDDERNKIMEYYSKLNMEVEKSKIHTDWKIRRLQLDQSRMQLLSTEERNLKREKLELEHQKNEEIMAMSIQSDVNFGDELDETKPKTNQDEDSNDSQSEFVLAEDKITTEYEDNKTKAQSSNVVFSALCNAAKSFFGVSRKTINDNNIKTDDQGNIVPIAEINSNMPTTSSSEIGRQLDEVFDNMQYLKMKEEALVNKQKVMAHEYGQPDKENNRIKDSSLLACVDIDDENNVQEIWTPFKEAKRNKLKILGADFGGVPDIPIVHEPKTDAQKEALLNKQKVLGVEYNIPLQYFSNKEPANIAQEEALLNKQKVLGVEYNLPLQYSSNKEPANIAQEEALRNKKRILTSDYGDRISKDGKKERSNLTLNLKPFSEVSEMTAEAIADTGMGTPGEYFPGIDLETPTTAEVPLESAVTADIFTPRSENSKDLEPSKLIDKEFLSAEGFNFPILTDDVAESDITSVQTDSPENSPTKSSEIPLSKYKKQSLFSILDGSYNLDEFDPFGIKGLKNFSNDYLSSKMDLEMKSSCYTHPSVIMEEVQKRPYANIFGSHFAIEELQEEKIACDNIATLTACLQRSVMLPLTYQLEVVNNSILTYFLVNLDMYEHLSSLKDYFFLMDGEFSRSICHNLFTKLVKTLNPQELLNFATLHNILDKALGSSISHVHKFSENLSFTISEAPLSFQHSSPDVLQCLSLTYSVSWPLNIILSQEALLRYAKVFQFLVKMRRIFWVLGEDFETLKLSVKLSKEHSRKLLRSPQYISIQIYRHIMASMIRALDNYIVTTCIQSSWKEFENDLKKARTLDDLYECHVVYIKKVLFRCLLNNRSTPVMKLLNDMFTVILKFSRVLKAGEWIQKEENGSFTHTGYLQLEELFHLFEKLAKYLHKVVTKLMECGYQRHLVELLTMINLNGYYDVQKSKDHNISVQSN